MLYAGTVTGISELMLLMLLPPPPVLCTASLPPLSSCPAAAGPVPGEAAPAVHPRQ